VSVNSPLLATQSETQLDGNVDFVYRVKLFPTTAERKFLSESKDRINAVMYWIIHDYAEISGDLSTAPPIQSRMYQELSNGMLGFQNSLKIADVPFPFPYAQLLTWMLLIFLCMIPFYMSSFTQSLVLSPIATFFSVVGIWSVNEVAIELENPFGSDVNDISCGDFHERFLEVLRENMASHIAKAKAAAVFEALKAEEIAEGLASSAKVAAVPASELIGRESETVSKDTQKVRSNHSQENAKPILPAIPSLSPGKPLNADFAKPSAGDEAMLTPFTPTVGAKDICTRLAKMSDALELRLKEILQELKLGGIPRIVSEDRGDVPEIRGVAVCPDDCSEIGRAPSPSLLSARSENTSEHGETALRHAQCPLAAEPINASEDGKESNEIAISDIYLESCPVLVESPSGNN
jgi:hypothetical protein